MGFFCLLDKIEVTFCFAIFIFLLSKKRFCCCWVVLKNYLMKVLKDQDEGQIKLWF